MFVLVSSPNFYFCVIMDLCITNKRGKRYYARFIEQRGKPSLVCHRYKLVMFTFDE